jgi:hypothetical protein
MKESDLKKCDLKKPLKNYESSPIKKMSQDSIQALLLSLLDANGIILDTKDLALEGRKLDTESVSNVLKRLANLDVSTISAMATIQYSNYF